MKFFAFCLLALLAVACTTNSHSVIEWRGPERTGIYEESNLLKNWPDNGPNLLWETEQLGDGYGSPLVLNDRILVMGTRDTTAVLLALDLDGYIIYETQLGPEWSVNFPGSRCTPTVIDDLAYVMTGKGNVCCLDVLDGEIKWSCDVFTKYEGKTPRFGYAQSLVVDGNKVFCCPGGEVNNVIALNRFTGDLMWSCKGEGERPGYNPAKLISVGDRKLFLTFSAYHLMAIDADSGEMIWQHEQVNTAPEDRKPGVGDTHGNTVLFDKNIVYYIEGDGNCAVALELNEDGSAYKQLWNNAVVDNFMGGIVLHNGFIYSCSYSANQLAKIDTQNGSVEESLPLGRGALIMADNMIYYYTMTGEVHLVSADSAKMQDVASFKIEKGSHEHFAHPVIHDGVLYVRHGNYLGAFSILK